MTYDTLAGIMYWNDSSALIPIGCRGVLTPMFVCFKPLHMANMLGRNTKNKIKYDFMLYNTIQ